jgi:hypothetical protein
MSRFHAVALAAVLALSAVGCGTAAGDGTDPDQPVDAPAASCPEGTTDCVDTPQLTDDEPVEVDETGIRQLEADARHHLGLDESELTELMRVGRRGDEVMALTEDYVIGRITVELDDLDGDGTHTVTSSTVELPDGPRTFTLDEG